jgi:hypothetical protein
MAVLIGSNNSLYLGSFSLERGFMNDHLPIQDTLFSKKNKFRRRSCSEFCWGQVGVIVNAVPELGFRAEDARSIGLSLFIART